MNFPKANIVSNTAYVVFKGNADLDFINVNTTHLLTAELDSNCSVVDRTEKMILLK